MTRHLLWAAGLLSCGAPSERPPGRVDVDEDGFTAGTDCDDADFRMNWLDVDGDGQASCGGDCYDFLPEVHTLDRDGDGNTTCDEVPDCDDVDPSREANDVDRDDWTTCDGDCDDTAENAVPGGDRVCGDGVDSDCDGFGDCRWHGVVDAWPIVLGEIRRGAVGAGLAYGHLGDVDRDGVTDVVAGGFDFRLFYGPLDQVSYEEQPDVLIDVSANQGAVVGDVTGDGVADAVVTHSALWEPTVSLIFAGPLVSTDQESDAVASLVTDVLGDGGMVTALADVDQDGFADLVRGEPLASDPITGASNDGCVYVARGPITGHLTREDVWHTSCVAPFGGLYGSALIELPDFTGAGTTILGVAGPSGTGEHAFWILAPEAGIFDVEDVALAKWTDPEATLGRAAANAGDTDGDGYDDLALSRERRAGATPGAAWDGALVVRGGAPVSSGHITDVADRVIVEEYWGPIAAAGDLDGDGHADLAAHVGLRPLVEPRGAIAVMYGPFVGTVEGLDQAVLFTGPPWNGQPMAPVGDLTGDGVGELALGVVGALPGDPVLLVLPGLVDGW